MATKNDQADLFPKGFFKQFKSKENFQQYFNSLFKQGIEEMLQGEMDEHLATPNTLLKATTAAIAETEVFLKPLLLKM